MKIKKIFIPLMLMLIVLSACGESKKKNEGSADGGKVTLNYAIWDSNQEKGIRKIADDFEKENQNIKINIEVNGWNDYWTMLEAAATGGSMPDTFWMHSNEIYRYASNGQLLDLDQSIKNSKEVQLDNYPEGLVKIYNQNNKQYAIPKDFDTIGLWYNKTMFDQAGVSYPDHTWTWTTLKDAAKKLTKADKSQYGILTPLHNQEGYYNFIYQNGGEVITKDKKSGYDEPKTTEALQYYFDFVKEGLSPEIFGDSERAEALQNGLAAMGFFGSWNIAGFKENAYMKDHFNVAVLPSSNSGGRASIFNGLGNAISAKTKHPDEAFKWIEYLSSKKGQEKQAELGVAISAYKGTADKWVDSSKEFNTKVFIDMLDYAQIRPYSNSTAKWEDKAYEILKAGYTGQKTAEQVGKEAAKMMNGYLAEEK